MNHNVRAALWSASDKDHRFLFIRPVDILVAASAGEAADILSRVEKLCGNGLYAVGFLSYESASGLDGALKTHDPAKGVPFAWFALFENAKKFELPCDEKDIVFSDEWRASVAEKEYSKNITRIKEYLRRGDTYQVNYTMRLNSVFRGDPINLFARLCRAQRSDYCFFIETDNFAICSASPELFFSLDGFKLVSRPMKGTMPRGMTLEEDELREAKLRASEKDRAENVMIVDMIRNDMGRVAEAGSVRVTSSFDIEKYPTVLQMTSTVECQTPESLAGIFRAMFPCASVTGAPKVRTMEIINELEGTPRGIYTGSIGCVFPGKKAVFNVAIRTVWLDRKSGVAEYGVGGGIVSDSDANGEFEECRAKSAVLLRNIPSFKLLETILWTRNEGYFLLDKHLNRMECSAIYFSFPFNRGKIEAELMGSAEFFTDTKCKVRILLNKEGHFSIEFTPLYEKEKSIWKVAVSDESVDKGDVFLYHKTTNRLVYDRARSVFPEHDDVILVNQDGLITESALANVVIVRNGRKVTPHASCGLLRGTFREHLLEQGEIEEGMVTKEDLFSADRIFLINSVRRWIDVVLV